MSAWISQIDTSAYLEISINDEVLVFDVTMGDSLRVQIVDGLNNLRKDIARLILSQALVLALLNALEEVVGWPARELRRRLWRRGEQVVIVDVGEGIGQLLEGNGNMQLIDVRQRLWRRVRRRTQA